MKEHNPKLSREDVAKLEIGHTDIAPAAARVLVLAFVLAIFTVPVVQQAWDVRRHLAGERASAWPQCYDFIRQLPSAVGAFSRTEGSLWRRTIAANRQVLRDTHRFEDALDDETLLGQVVRPPIQYALALLGGGNEKAYCGVRPWLFYAPEVGYLTASGFLDPAFLARREMGGDEWQAPPQADPVRGILDFHRQLAERGIRLVVVPTPAKPMIHPDKLAPGRRDWILPLQNASYRQFVEKLEEAGVLVFDPASELSRIVTESGRDQFLQTDTHWTPEAMQAAARRLAEFVRGKVELPPAAAPALVARDAPVTNRGDIVAMLRLPERQSLYPLETVTVRQVRLASGDDWRHDPAADMLLLGDSFSNIYSSDRLGWGESAGLAEQLALELQRPVDRIVVNDNGAYATRAVLARELARGRDRLAGKRVVVWQFAARELAGGDWQLVDLTLGTPAPSVFVAPARGGELVVRGEVQAVSRVPRPGSVPYRDHVLAVHLVDLEGVAGDLKGNEALVYMMSMADNEWTAAARLRPGDDVRVRLVSWMDVADRYEGINRSELDDEDLQLQEPCWGELEK